MADFQPRPGQQQALAYTGGKMGLSAVPGSGKTHTLAVLAAQLVATAIADDQEVLIVTLVNSAVDNFKRRINQLIARRGLLTHIGYRVRTLHGLAHDIVRERPALVGLAEDFQIADEWEAAQILQDAVDAWVSQHPEVADLYLDPTLEESKLVWVRREHWPRLVSDFAASFIRQAKDLQATPADVRQNLDALPEPLPLLEMGWAIYADYQRGLAYRGAVDYDDLIRLALRALQLDADYLQRLRYRWPYILEDEAQDSSALQEQILRLLVGPQGNWVRVGDPNQAIYETFTTASPHFLRNFLQEPGVIARELPDSGRSTQSIIDLANFLVDWCRTQHPVPALRDALAPVHIVPTPPDDPQPNPPDDPGQVYLIPTKYTPAEELEAVVTSLARWLPQHPDQTVAVLVPRNDRGEAVVRALKARGLEYVELLRSTSATREAAGALANLLNYLADPLSGAKLATAYRVWRRGDRGDEEANARLELAARALRRCRRVEEFLWPPPTAPAGWPDRAPGQPGLGPLELPAARNGLPAARNGLPAARNGLPAARNGLPAARNGPPEDDFFPSPGAEEGPELRAALRAELETFRTLMRRWLGATLLPIDQLILTVAQDLFDQPADLALAYKLALVLRQASDHHPEWRLPELVRELALVARNERKFLGFSDADTGFDPEKHRGKVVVATAHKAKGLEWDRVYIMSVNNYDFPSAQPHDSYISERWFIRDGLNLEAEGLAQLRGLFSQDMMAAYTTPGVATAQARLDYATERLRLLYVAITRAKRELIITWNTGRAGDLQPAVPFIALRTFWEQRARERS